MDTYKLKVSIKEWSELYLDTRKNLIKRLNGASIPKKGIALALLGVRRSGKTSLAIQITESFKPEEIFYYNFEDPIFIAEPNVLNLDLLLEAALEISRSDFKVLILDEIHNIKGWEKWLRKQIDLKKYQIVVTGSSAELLLTELSSALTGRTIVHNVWPLDFREYLLFKKQNASQANFSDFLNLGSFPEVALSDDNNFIVKLLRQYQQDLISRDILPRQEIRKKQVLDQIVLYYLTNISSLHSYSAISKAFNLSVDLVQAYTNALEEAFFIFQVYRYHPNLKVQARDAKKIYAIDCGMRNVNSRSLQDDFGKLLENAVYIELRRREKDVYYYSQSFEIDFLITNRGKPQELIQVCASDLNDPQTYQRETRALIEGMQLLNLNTSTLISWNREEIITTSSGKIQCIPAWKWFQASQ